MTHYKEIKAEISKQKSFNIKTFKKILFIYAVIFIILCILVPCNKYFDGSIGFYGIKGEDQIINYSLSYAPIWSVGYKDYHNDRIYINGHYQFGKGVMVTKLNIPLLVIELLILTLIFAITSFFLCMCKTHD